MKLTTETVASLQLAKVFKDNERRINSLSVSTPNGELCVTGSDDDSIHIYDCIAGKQRSKLYSKKYGVDHIRFAHGAKSVIHASTKVDNTIRYLSLHDNKYLRYFIGHTQRVTTLATSLLDDLFLSAAQDGTMRLWDLRSPNCQGILHTTGAPVAGFDPEGVIFAAGIESRVVKLYDVRSFDRGPFSTFPVPSGGGDFIDLCFSNDGKNILVSTAGGRLFLVDSFEGNQIPPKQLTPSPRADGRSLLKGAFSPDGQYVFCGSVDGEIHVWSASTGKQVTTLRGQAGAVECVAFNPKYFMLISGSGELDFWIPPVDDEK